MTAREDILIGVWAAMAGAASVLSPFVAEEFPAAFAALESVGRSVYAVALALCVVALALRLARRVGGADRASDKVSDR